MADLESQKTPFSLAGVTSDEQPFTITGKSTNPKDQKSSKILVYILAGVVCLGIILLIVATVFLRVTNPKLRLSSVAIQNFQYENTNSTSLNMTMLTEVKVSNENFGRYVFENCTAVILYGNSTIGGGDISGGRVRARESETISFMMQVRSENLNFSSGGSTDSTDLVEIRSYAKMTGRVRVMKIVNRMKSIEMNCTIAVNFESRSIMYFLCR